MPLRLTERAKEILSTGRTGMRNLNIFRLCEHCNKEFELKVPKYAIEDTVTFCNCPHCDKRNDLWLRIPKGVINHSNSL